MRRLVRALRQKELEAAGTKAARIALLKLAAEAREDEKVPFDPLEDWEADDLRDAVRRASTPISLSELARDERLTKNEDLGHLDWPAA